MRFHLFVSWNIYTVIFLILFLSWLFLFCWCSCCRYFSEGCNKSSSASFNVSLYRCIDGVLNASKSSSRFFFWHVTSVYVVSGYVRPYALSLVFPFSGSFVWVLLFSTLRMVPSILRRGGLPRYLFFWWNFCYVVWFRVVFSFSCVILFCIFSFIVTCLMVSASNIPKYFYVSISPSVLIFSWFASSIPSDICRFRFLQLAWHIFPSLYLDCLFSQPV